MASPPVQGAPLPPENNRRWWRVISPKGRSGLLAVLLSDTFVGIWTHWEGCPVACDNSPDCPRCKSGEGLRWTGYIPAVNPATQQTFILALTEGAARQLLPFLERYKTLRGLYVELKRHGPGKPNDPVRVTFKTRIEPSACPPDFPIQDSLNKLFGLNENWLQRGRVKRSTNTSSGPESLPVRPNQHQEN